MNEVAFNVPCLQLLVLNVSNGGGVQVLLPTLPTAPCRVTECTPLRMCFTESRGMNGRLVGSALSRTGS